jgi:hypothetical protein
MLRGGFHPTHSSIFAVAAYYYRRGWLRFSLSTQEPNVPSRGPELAGIRGGLLAFSIATVSVRCYIRSCITKSLGYDDWLAVATLLSSQCTREPCTGISDRI